MQQNTHQQKLRKYSRIFNYSTHFSSRNLAILTDIRYNSIIQSFQNSQGTVMPPPEEKARKTIDQKLKAAGWFIQSMDELNLGVADK